MGVHSHIQIPYTILKHFRDETDSEKKVWCLDIRTKTIFKKPAKRLGTAKGYYSLDGEKFWKQTIEDPIGKLNKQVLDFSSGETQHITFNPNDMDIVKRYILSALVRSQTSLNEMRDVIKESKKYSSQNLHDAISVIGMENSKEIANELNFDYMVSTVLVNRTDKSFVVPRNCFYCVERKTQPNYVMPISPKTALILLPKSQLQKEFGNYAVIDNFEMIARLNRHALKYECLFNQEFVASNNCDELKPLQELLFNPPW